LNDNQANIITSTTEVLMNVTPQESRVAVVENGVVQELIIERSRKRGLVGNIYKGKVCRVLPGMEAAFVEIGLERAAFLHASDINQPKSVQGEEAEVLPINSVLHEGQHILVQVVKDPLGTKGARLTAQITIPSRYLVLMPCARGSIGVSTRIEEEEERSRLRKLTMHLRDPEHEHGYILRTVAEGVTDEELQRDIEYLNRQWEKIQEREKSSKPGTCIYADLPLVKRVLRDMVGIEIERISIDSRETYREVKEFAEAMVPEMAERLTSYSGQRPVLDMYGVEDEIQKALQRKVVLKSGPS